MCYDFWLSTNIRNTCNNNDIRLWYVLSQSVSEVFVRKLVNLKDSPKPEDHVCWASRQDISIKAARTMMYKMTEEDPTRPVLEIYEEVRKTFTEGMDMTKMQA